MKKSLIVCFVAFLSIQAEEAPLLETDVQIIEMTQKLKRAHDELRTLRAQLAAILTIVLEELEDFETTRGIDFNAWNNLQDEYEKQQGEFEDAEDTEGDQE